MTAALEAVETLVGVETLEAVENAGGAAGTGGASSVSGIPVTDKMRRFAETARQTALGMNGYRSKGQCAKGVNRSISEWPLAFVLMATEIK